MSFLRSRTPIGSNFNSKGNYIPSWLYKSSTKKTLVDKANDILLKDPVMMREFLSWRSTIVWTSIILGVLYLGLTFTFLGISISKDASSLGGNLYVNVPVYDPTTFSYTSGVYAITSVTYHLWWIIIAFPFVCVIFLALNVYMGWATFADKEDKMALLNGDMDETSSYYYEILLVGGNRAIWLLKCISHSAILWLVAVLCGVTDLVVLILLVGMNISLQLTGGLFHEWWNNGMTQAFRFDQDKFHDVKDISYSPQYTSPPELKKDLQNLEMAIGVNYPKAPGVSMKSTSDQEYLETRRQEKVQWLPLGVGVILFALILGVLFTYFALAVTSISVPATPWYAWAALFIFVGFELIFAIVILVHYLYVEWDGNTFLKRYEEQSNTYELIKRTRLDAVKRNGTYEWVKLMILHVTCMVIITVFFIAIYVR